MKRHSRSGSLVLTLILIAVIGHAARAEGREQWRRSDAALEARMRELWDAQVTWTRFYVVSALGDLPDTSNAMARLFRCPIDFEAVVGPYYGRQAAQDFSAAMGRHLQTLVAVVRATREGDVQTLAALKLRLRADAETTSSTLGRVNPAWSAPNFRERLDVYLQCVDRGVALRARGDFATEIGNYGESREQALGLGDIMARDILNQFSSRLAPSRNQ